MQQHRKELCNPRWMIFETFLANCRELRGLPARGARLVVPPASLGIRRARRTGRGVMPLPRTSTLLSGGWSSSGGELRRAG
jgi:hypothetical protein